MTGLSHFQWDPLFARDQMATVPLRAMDSVLFLQAFAILIVFVNLWIDIYQTKRGGMSYPVLNFLETLSMYVYLNNIF